MNGFWSARAYRAYSKTVALLSYYDHKGLSKHVDCLLTFRLNKDLCKLLSRKEQNPQETQE
jgi:hypothetical protein